MRTAKAAISGATSSPGRAVASLSALIGTFGTVTTALWSSIILDDLLVAIVVVLIGSAAYFQPDWAVALIEWCQPEVVWRIPTKELRAALTIDDVPLLDWPTSFEEILDVLKENGVKATFFIMSGFTLPPSQGGMSEEKSNHCKRLLRRAVEEGHELGNHLQFDKPAFAMTHAEFETAFRHCDALLAEMAGGEDAWRGRSNRWFRPGSGLWTPHILSVASEAGYKTVLANCFPHDVSSISRHVNPLYLRWRVRVGSVIVVHDRWHTPNTLRASLPSILRSGISLGTLSSLQAAPAAGSSAGKKAE